MYSNEPRIAIALVNVVSRTMKMEIPSIPRAYDTPQDSIQGVEDSRAKPPSPGSKLHHNPRLRTKTRADHPNAMCRARSAEDTRTCVNPAAGSQISAWSTQSS